ncbi:hypothetical protein NLU13_8663 [Sarocladium strictum]|uniref:Frequency clock protein n=1 Tax=Sarocladium strictum TaxID=5046 RepID=A0AA39GC39_SARSR|nr:hypothetical protein NLU13_8663 [Sarocladium strictum]
MPEPEATARESHRGHPLPRRTSPANSVTLKHHRLARDASLRASAGSGPPNKTNSNSNSNSSPRRNSSGESHNTGGSDPRKWFDQSNQNPTATFDNNVMEVDPPFFQKESDSSNEDRPYQFQQQTPGARLLPAQSSSADDYRSVIDDLTVEIQKLKEELKRYKQKGPDLLRKEKLFEIKIHGLPKRKKRELETTLRDFAASLDGSPDTSSSQQRKGRHANRDNMYGRSGSMSKHASSSSGSNTRPVDSAYASMSTGAHSSGTSLGRPSMSLRSRSSEQKVENYLRDIPEGLYPRQTVMTEKEKKKLVVRRLEQLFTGKITGRGIRRILPPPPPTANPAALAAAQPNSDSDVNALAPVTLDAQGQQQSTVHQPPSLMAPEPSREARILPTEQQQQGRKKKSRSRDDASASNSYGDQTEGNSSGGTSTSPSQPTQPEQRPTRPKDLDPDRVQVPADNMDYIRHLGLVPPELLSDTAGSTEDVNPDAEGWVYLNLLCNLAQLHIINVTPSFVRAAVTEMSTKFQLSPDSRKIRWRGGTDGTRFTSDSSGDNSHMGADTDDTDGGDKKQRKRQKTKSTGDDLQSGGSSSKNPSKFGPQISGSSESFHYKPLFVQQDSLGGNSSPDDTLSSFGPIEDSQVGESGWGQSGSGTSNRRKRRHDGAIIYYSGAPFCTDLSGDTGDISPTTYMMSSGQAQQEGSMVFERPLPFRSASGSSLDYRPLRNRPRSTAEVANTEVDAADPGLITDTGDEASEIDFEMPWTDDQQYIEVRPLEPCGLGGVLPDDHFMVVVTTARPKVDSPGAMSDILLRGNTEEATDSIISRLATMSTSSPKPLSAGGTPIAAALATKQVEIRYMSGRIKRLAPMPLPPPAIFFPPFSTETSSSDEEGMSIDIEDDESSVEELMSRQANPHQSDGYPDGVDLTSGDEDGEDPDDEPGADRMYDTEAAADEDAGTTKSGSALARAGTGSRGRSKSVVHGGSSAATAGGVPSEFSSSDDE